MDRLYGTHKPTNLVQKSILAVGSGVMSILDPSRDDMISIFGETTGVLALKSMQEKMIVDPEGDEILKKRPVINTKTVDLNFLKSLPAGTLGKEYSNFLAKYNLTPDARRPVSFIDDAELAYVMRRYREIHDLTHVTLGMPINMLGEVTVKWFEGIQYGLPMCALGGFFGSVRLGPRHTAKYLNLTLPWIVRTARQSRLFINVYFEKHWHKPLVEFRRELNIVEPPPKL
ncbi:unnamed protein product [Rotaria socialis]|uniref:Ubiquinone biosynthesis protein COQ4 homolog, mitochondrial n=1 Tax=Rotaria socialis TaxID=392032 RepID=A0A820KXZ2_9BILA|nr:unnamed protein product [Rotaria socialis]CAF3441948.1 unnamed protein product [Rotaria socialis]CAF3496711.1 unnamed protein product [Rotaria socialis]CAF3649063.1 unnamed protein product [Rotaria socialis]CAF3685443.1 unnamed protein product [Rotaria socialis]